MAVTFVVECRIGIELLYRKALGRLVTLQVFSLPRTSFRLSFCALSFVSFLPYYFLFFQISVHKSAFTLELLLLKGNSVGFLHF